MNSNRQNNRCIIPPMPPFSNRPMGCPIGRPSGVGGCAPVPMPCPEVCNPCSDNTPTCPENCNPCVEDCSVNVCNDGCNDCFDNTSSGVVISGCSGCVSTCNKETVLQNMALAMAYVPWQPYENLYSLSQALRSGTIFRDLELDFKGRRCN